MKCLWVWNLDKKDIKSFNEFCKQKNIKKVFLNYKVYNLSKNIKVDCVPLIGDSKNELSFEEIIKICKPYKKVHLDIELAVDEDMDSYLGKLFCILNILKSENKYIELDIETWNKTRTYKKIIKNADEIHLMSYSPSIIGTYFKTIGFKNKPFYVGIETNPDLKISMKEPDKKIPIINFINSFNKNYRGTSVHCWGFINDRQMHTFK